MKKKKKMELPKLLGKEGYDRSFRDCDAQWSLCRDHPATGAKGCRN